METMWNGWKLMGMQQKWMKTNGNVIKMLWKWMETLWNEWKWMEINGNIWKCDGNE